MRHLPNLICLLRIVLIWPLVQSLRTGDYQTTLWVFVIAAVSDGADGFLAKRFGWTSELGSVLDPLADKLLLVTLFLMAAWLGLIPRWLTVMAVSRDVMIGIGALTYKAFWGPLRGRPTLISKLNTLMQLILLSLVILHAGFGQPPVSVLDALAWLTGLTIVLSGLAYLRLFTARALRERASFDSFEAGDNTLAVSMLRDLVTSRRSGLVWLAGAAATGKTHLLQAVCAAVAREGAASYLPLHELAPLGVEALAGFGQSHCSCIDDIDAVLANREWERALFNLYRDAEERGATLLWSASASPQALRFALPDLASRAAAGQLLVLKPLNEAQQGMALQRRARLRGFELPDETVQYLLRHWPRDMRTQCALLDSLDDAALQAQRRITVPFIRAVLPPRG
jgi:DnaA regulatory inactivator Hda